MHITSTLEIKFKLGRLSNCWLLQANNCDSALAEVKNFVSRFLLGEVLSLEANPDFKLIERDKASNAKNISVDQIRELGLFLSKTAGLDGYKVAVIYQADFMNLNAANSCLKLLEDTSKNTFIFLITSKAASILPTIRSRCAKLTARDYNIDNDDDQKYNEFLTIITSKDISIKLNFIQSFTSGDRALWADMANCALILLAKLAKKASGVQINFNELETQVMQELLTSPKALLEKFAKLNKLIDNTILYDLELRASSALLLNEFCS